MSVQGFPNSGQPFTSPGRLITQSWLFLLQSLWIRTGGSGGASTVPSGAMNEYAGPTVPAGWLPCDGAAVSRTQYANLFAAIGTTWGAGDGSTTFNVPNLNNVFLRGSGAQAVGATGGAASVSLTTGQLPAHNHGVTDPGHTHTFTGAPHTHSITDPGHTHGITDPGHVHAALTATSLNTPGVTAGSSTAGNTASATTGVTVNSATTGVTNANATAGGTNASATTGVTTNNTGSGTAVPIIPPYAVVLRIIKT